MIEGALTQSFLYLTNRGSDPTASGSATFEVRKRESSANPRETRQRLERRFQKSPSDAKLSAMIFCESHDKFDGRIRKNSNAKLEERWCGGQNGFFTC